MFIESCWESHCGAIVMALGHIRNMKGENANVKALVFLIGQHCKQQKRFQNTIRRPSSTIVDEKAYAKSGQSVLGS